MLLMVMGIRTWIFDCKIKHEWDRRGIAEIGYSVPKVVSLWRRFLIGSVTLRTRYGVWSRAQ
jgi:hypothetical protein